MIFFWGIKGKNAYLSNFFYCNITIKVNNKDVNFCCSEQLFMFMKALYFKDKEIANEIINKKNKHPNEYKSLGRKVKNYNEIEWNKNRKSMMIFCLKEKFNQNIDLLNELLSTNSKILVEASPYDLIWGVGLKEDNPLIKDPKYWKGTNLLGQCLMEVRKDFQLNKPMTKISFEY